MNSVTDNSGPLLKSNARIQLQVRPMTAGSSQNPGDLRGQPASAVLPSPSRKSILWREAFHVKHLYARDELDSQDSIRG